MLKLIYVLFYSQSTSVDFRQLKHVIFSVPELYHDILSLDVVNNR